MKLALLSLVLLSVLAPRAEAQPVEFTDELRALSAVAACDGSTPPAAIDAAAVKRHCDALGKIMAGYEADWATPARKFFADLVPEDVPKTVVYPFGGADLLTALVVYPDLSELTSISLEAGGDPRSILRIDSDTFEKHLALHRKFIAKLVHWNHSRTLDLALLKGTPFPSQMIFALVGLHAHGYEPVGLKAIRLDPNGSIHYFTKADLDAADAQAKELKGSQKNRRLNDLFAGYELSFRKKGSSGATAVQVYRHFQMNLDNEHLAADPRILKHLDAKGRIAAMTKAASYLLWWGNFKTFRDQLLKQVVWMVSDSTGPLARDLGPEWEQVTYGTFTGASLDIANREGQKAFAELWAAQPQRPLPFRYFGYPSRGLNTHLLVTKRR